MQIDSASSIIRNMDGINADKKTQGDKGFSDLFGEVLENVKETEKAADTANMTLLSGESDDIHSAIIAAQKAEVAVSLAVQIRNKVVESYNQVMNMQV